jgi:pantoate--beta-alanine ligase
MGALHRGHLSLIEASRRDGHWTVVSIYVNPTQFGPAEDFSKYPRTFETDRAGCRAAGTDLIFIPQDSEMYTPGDQTRVHPGALAETLCGLARPGHFAGVCTVVAKLFNIVQPDVAYFGQKDAQQAIIIQRMVRDLHMPLQIVVCPLVREPDGLAMSSRNARLSAEQREQALCLYRALCRGRDELKSGAKSIGHVIAAMRTTIAESGPAIGIDYLSIVDPQTLAPITSPKARVMIAGAVRIGDVRLIDNILVELT